MRLQSDQNPEECLKSVQRPTGATLRSLEIRKNVGWERTKPGSPWYQANVLTTTRSSALWDFLVCPIPRKMRTGLASAPVLTSPDFFLTFWLASLRLDLNKAEEFFATNRSVLSRYTVSTLRFNELSLTLMMAMLPGKNPVHQPFLMV